MHSAGGAQPLGDGDVPLRPRAPRVSGCESSPERCAVATPELPIDPAKADRLVECLVVGERCRVCSALLGKDEPHSLRLGLVAAQPGAPLGSINDQQLWKVHVVTVSPLAGRTPASGASGDNRALLTPSRRGNGLERPRSAPACTAHAESSQSGPGPAREQSLPALGGVPCQKQRREPSRFGSSISREGGMGRERFGAGRP